MNEFKDKQVIIARLYLFIVPLLILINYCVGLIGVLFDSELVYDVDGLTGSFNEIIGALAFGYGFACLTTIIYLFINLFRKSKKGIKILLCVILIPAIAIFAFPSTIATIPIYFFTVKKTKQITIDNKPLYSKNRIITLAVLLVFAVIITIITCVK